MSPVSTSGRHSGLVASTHSASKSEACTWFVVNGTESCQRRKRDCVRSGARSWATHTAEFLFEVARLLGAGRDQFARRFRWSSTNERSLHVHEDEPRDVYYLGWQMASGAIQRPLAPPPRNLDDAERR
jgi:hypothetical protein